MATVNSTPTRPAPRARAKTGSKASEAIPAYGAGAGVLSFRYSLRARERGVIDRALEIVGRCFSATGSIFATPDAVKTYLCLHLAGEQHERFAVLFLDVQNRFIAFETMFIGTLTQTSVYPREVVRAAIAHGAAAVVLAHNHPSGTVTPSRADEALTQTLKTALSLIDVRVLDHVIVAPGEALSMAERGLL
ncbi:MAG: DNA repair protein RadC [Gallionella sp.]|nr:DNA repair protein RadC [Gallionella sp.]